MTEQPHVSIETGRKLAAAGLQRGEWQEGDWYCWDTPYAHAFRPERVVHNPEVALWFTGRVKDGLPGPLWLPTGQQLLELLAEMERLVDVSRGGWQQVDSAQGEGRMTTWCVDYDDGTDLPDDWPYVEHASLAEAAALAWLAVATNK